MPVSKPLTKGEKRRGEVLSVARTHLIEKGYDAFSMREVAANLGTKIGHIQYYFPARTDLFEALVRKEFKNNLNSVMQIKNATKHPTTALEEVAKALLRNWIAEGAPIYALMSFLAMHNDRFKSLKSDIYDQFHTIIDELICDIRECGASSDTEVSARLITSVMDGVLLQQNPDDRLMSAIIANVMNIAANEPKV